MTAQITLCCPPSHVSAHHRHSNSLSEVRHLRLGLQASLAEMLLLNKLRARTRRDLASDTLQRGADIIELTAKHWFSGSASGRDERSNSSLPVAIL